jgi:RNA polymerase sigma factor (TIGR02999 family)
VTRNHEEPDREVGDDHYLTSLLQKVGSGDTGAADELMAQVYAQLKAIAARRMANERKEHTLRPTDLVHETYIKISGSLDSRDWKSRGQFFAAAAEAMRRILVDHARGRMRAKRGGGCEREFTDVVGLAAEGDSEAVLALNEALDQLERVHERAAQVVKLRFFGGLSVIETGEALGISERSTVRYWRFARAWLYKQIAAGNSS